MAEINSLEQEALRRAMAMRGESQHHDRSQIDTIFEQYTAESKKPRPPHREPTHREPPPHKFTPEPKPEHKHESVHVHIGQDKHEHHETHETHEHHKPEPKPDFIKSEKLFDFGSGTNILDHLIKDKEKMLIIVLILILIEEHADSSLILALMYMVV